MNVSPRKILMFSSDEKIFDRTSNARARMRMYARACDELHIVVLSARSAHARFVEGSLRVNATNSLFKIFAPWHAIKMGKKIARRAPLHAGDSLVTAQDPFEIGYVGWRVAHTTGLPFQLQVHTDFLSPFFARENFKNRVRMWLAKFLLPRAQYIRAVSARVADSLRVIGCDPQKIIIQPIAVDTATASAAPRIDLHEKFPEFEYIALVVSRLTHEKNIWSAVEAVARVRAATGKNIGLVIVGDGPERATLARTDFVRCLGWIDAPVGYMKGADLFLNTSLYEGYGRTLVEAAAAGVPIVSTDVGIAREIVVDGKNGFIVPVADTTALADAVKKFCTQ